MDQLALNIQHSVTLFISFDLVNATLYKTTHKGTWTLDLSTILRHVIQTFTKKENDGYRFWKTLGDEVIFTKNIPYVFEVEDILNEIYQDVVSINRNIAAGIHGGTMASHGLSIKATVWAANISSTHQHADNFYTEYQINKNQLQPEYLGTDIDAGFRIAKYTSSNRLLISFELAALFYKDPLLRRKMHRIHFLGVRSLKGIWEGVSYPIFMYHGDDRHSFADSIINDSLPQTEILQEYLKQLPNRIVRPPYQQYEEQVIAEFCENTVLNNNIEQLFTVIKQQNLYTISATAPRLRVHYSVLCVDTDCDEPKFIITKDQQGLWGLGGAVMDHNLNYLDTIQLYYQEEFGVELDFIKDNRYHDPIPLILTTYHMDDDGTQRKGSVLLAKISSEKFWGDLSETYDAYLLTYPEIEMFQFYDCKSPKEEIFDSAIKYLSELET